MIKHSKCTLILSKGDQAKRRTLVTIAQNQYPITTMKKESTKSKYHLLNIYKISRIIRRISIVYSLFLVEFEDNLTDCSISIINLYKAREIVNLGVLYNFNFLVVFCLFTESFIRRFRTEREIKLSKL